MLEYKINDCDYNIKEFIKNIVSEEFNITSWNEWFEEQDYDSLKVKPNVLVSCESDDKLIGICSIKKMSDKECYLNSFYVLKEYRGSGVGSKLYDICWKFAVDNGYEKITLKVDSRFEKAIKFYEKRGYIFDNYNDQNEEITYHKIISLL